MGSTIWRSHDGRPLGTESESSMTNEAQAAPGGPTTTAENTVAPPAVVPLVRYEDFARLDLRVARILEAREHPNANKLLLLKIRVGDVEKQIVAGIRGHYDPAALSGRSIIVVNNLEPAMIRGEESNGMLLAASDAGSVVLVQPEREIADGSKVK
jgi:tRNA-binding protein